VQAAIDAAVAAGGAGSIWIRQGTYTEDLTLYDDITIEGQESFIATIIGTHTPPAAGYFSFNNIRLQSATHVFSSAVAGTADLACSGCEFNLTNGYVYNLTNWTGGLHIHFCFDDISTDNGLVYNTGGSEVSINSSIVGAGTNVFTANGDVTIFSSTINSPFLFNGAGSSTITGGSRMLKNIETDDTHWLRIGMSTLSTGAAQAITHNSTTDLTLDTVILGSANAEVIGGTGTVIEIMVQFPNSNGIAATITESLAGVTRTAEMWAENIIRMEDTGFYEWDAAGPYFDDTTLGTFQLLVAGSGYIKDQRVTWAAQNINGLTAGSTWYIYIDSDGVIGKTNARTDALFVDNIVLFECMRDSTPITNNQVTVKENHPYAYQVGISNYQHNNIGPVIENVSNGANITLSGTQKISISGADVYSDHGLSTTIADSGGVGVSWYRYYTDGAGKWARQNYTDTFTGYWNNAGTATVLTTGKYGVYRLYVSKDNLNAATPTYYAVLNTAEYNNLAAAQTAIANGSISGISGELNLLELAQLGYIIYKESDSTIIEVNISKTTLRSTTSTSGASTANLVTTTVTNFDGILSAVDTNVQAALETIDDFGKDLTNNCVVVGNGNGNPLGVIGAGTTGELLVGATGADPAFASLAYGDFTFSNLTPATMTTLTVSNGDGDPASGAELLLGVGATAGDPYVNWQISATQSYAAGIDNSTAGDPWNLTNSSDPSSGDALMSLTSAGVITLFNDLDVSEGGTGVSTLTSHGILLGNGASDIQALAEATDGQIPIGSTGNNPTLATITAGSGVSVTNAAGSITVAASGGGMTWEEVTDATKNMVINTAYGANRGGGVTFTLPATAAVGTRLEIVGIAGNWALAQNAGQTVYVGDGNTTVGVGGSLTATDAGDCIRLVCISADTSFRIISMIGNITIA